MHTVKNGVRNGKQLYVCKSCNHQFRSGAHIDGEALWRKNQEEKLTISAIAKEYELSISTTKRRLKEINKEWTQPPLCGGGFVHIVVTC